MPLALTCTTAPEQEPVSLEDAKEHLRVEGEDEDALIAMKLAAARSELEETIRRAIITQTWRLKLDAFPDGAGDILLPRPPLQSVTSITYVDADGATQTLATSVYEAQADEEPARVTLKYGQNWPAVRDQPNAVTVTFEAGYGDSPEDVPAPLRAWLLLRMAELYENREPTVIGTVVGRMQDTLDRLADPFVVPVL